MYNEKLEALISAALADGVLTDKEKNLLFKKAEAMGIDRDEFELVLDGRLAKRKKEMEAQASQATKPAKKEGAIPQELDDLIKEYLTDGIISAKERQVLLNKAQTLGLNVDEVDLYIDAQQQKADQAVAAAVNKRRGKTCPYCGSSIPELTDKCPNCGGNITPEASKELEDIFDHLESALVNFKSGEDVEKNKAEVERYVRKARMYYGNNPKVQHLLEEVEMESEAAEEEARKNAKKKFWLNIIEKNKKFVLIAIAVISVFGYIWYESTAQERKEADKERKEAEWRQAYQEEKATKNANDLAYVQNTAKEVNDFLEKDQIDKAANALTMCEASGLGNPLHDNEQATSLYKSLVANVVDAYLDKGKKKKAQNLVISCSSKFDFGKIGLSELFEKLGSDGNYEFH